MLIQIALFLLSALGVAAGIEQLYQRGRKIGLWACSGVCGRGPSGRGPIAGATHSVGSI